MLDASILIDPDFEPRALELVFCQECGNWFQPPSPGWLCPKCQRKAEYAVQPGKCEKCGGKCNCVRVGATLVRSLCLCSETPQQRAIRLKAEADTRHRAELERQAQQLAQERLDAERGLRGQAAACWQARQHNCSEKPNAYPECRLCVRWQRITKGE